MHGPQSTFYEPGSCSESYNFLQQLLTSKDHFCDTQNISNIDTISMAEAKAVAANKSHSEAERRRRKRINGHLATLRDLVPKTIKADKASLLAEVVRRVRELKKTTEEFTGTGDERNASTKLLLIPGETDELKICYENDQVGAGIVKATLCCEDRPQMMAELTRALNAVQATVVRAEMATVGGRTKTVLWLKVVTGGAGRGGEEGGLGTIRKAMKMVLDKSIMLPGAHGQSLPGNKRPRLYHG